MSGLAELQELLGAAVLAQGSQPELPFDSRGLEVYRQAYRLRLAEVLHADYPILARLLGEHMFDDLVRAYIETHRSIHFSVRWFGRDLDRHVLRHAHAETRRIMAEVARLEWLLGEAFDAADAPVASVQALAAIALEDWPKLVLRMHPTVRLLRVHDATLACWEWARDVAAGGDGPPPCTRAAGSRSTVVVWRTGTLVRYRALDRLRALALTQACAGASVAIICDTLTRHHAEAEVPNVVARLLAEWLGSGLVAAAGLDG